MNGGGPALGVLLLVLVGIATLAGLLVWSVRFDPFGSRGRGREATWQDDLPDDERSA